jgi:hypothetical protein
MGEFQTPEPALLVVAAFSRHAVALTWAEKRLENEFGPVGLRAVPYAFTQTEYYKSAMGPGLTKQLLAFQKPVPAEALAPIKHRTNALEAELAAAGTYPEPRPLNLDPGLLSLGKFVLATSKDQAHRVYLADGVYAEVTVRFEAGRFTPWPWTYADYRLPEVLEFLGTARDFYRRAVRHSGPTQTA